MYVGVSEHQDTPMIAAYDREPSISFSQNITYFPDRGAYAPCMSTPLVKETDLNAVINAE